MLRGKPTRGFNPRIFCLWMSYHNFCSIRNMSSVSSQSPLIFVHKLMRRWMDWSMLAIKFCLLSAKLLTDPIDLRDTLVIALWHITWALIPRSVAFFPRACYIRQLFGQITVPVVARFSVLASRSAVLSFAIFDDDSFDESHRSVFWDIFWLIICDRLAGDRPTGVRSPRFWADLVFFLPIFI